MSRVVASECFSRCLCDVARYQRLESPPPIVDYQTSLNCFIVCADRRSVDQPLFVAVDLDSKAAYQRAKSFLRGYRSPQAVLCRGQAELCWSPQQVQSSTR